MPSQEKSIMAAAQTNAQTAVMPASQDHTELAQRNARMLALLCAVLSMLVVVTVISVLWLN